MVQTWVKPMVRASHQHHSTASLQVQDSTRECLKLELKPAREEELYGSIRALCSRSFLWDPAAPANLLHVTLQSRGRSRGPSTAKSHII